MCPIRASIDSPNKPYLLSNLAMGHTAEPQLQHRQGRPESYFLCSRTGRKHQHLPMAKWHAAHQAMFWFRIETPRGKPRQLTMSILHVVLLRT